MGRLTLVSIAIAFILVEGVPMLAAWLKREMVREAEEKGREEGLEQGLGRGIERGRASERKAWKTWLRETEEWESRKSEAERLGYTFIEPRPEVPGSEQESEV